jgi:hypothetical protein
MSMFKSLSIVILSSSLAFAGCKKKEDAAAAGAAAKPAETAPAKAGEPASAKPAEPAAAAPAAGGATITSDDDYIAKGKASMDKMTEIFKAAGTDCDKLGDELLKFATDNAALIASSKAYEAAHPDAKKKYDEASKDKSAAFETAAGQAMTACQGNKKVGEALTKLAE